jgi:signal transduction histidine kinase
MAERADASIDLTPAPGAVRRRWMPVLAAGLSIGEYARSLVRRLAFLTACLLAGIWLLTGEGYLWPAWAWLGLGVLVLVDLGAGWAWRRSPGALRRVACVWTIVGVAATILVCTWLLTYLLAHDQSFWPAWALLGLATAGSAYSLIALHDRLLVARGRRALRARIDMLTRTRSQAVDAQAAELRRIERDLHDGAQARLVALTLQLGRAEVRVHDQPELRGLISTRSARRSWRSPSYATSRAGSCRRCWPTAAWSRRSSRSPPATASAPRSTRTSAAGSRRRSRAPPTS